MDHSNPTQEKTFQQLLSRFEDMKEIFSYGPIRRTNEGFLDCVPGPDGKFLGVDN